MQLIVKVFALRLQHYYSKQHYYTRTFPQVCFLLRELLHEHPSMKLVVVREVEFFMFRPGLSEQARYYCIVFLNQMVLTHKESEGAPCFGVGVSGPCGQSMLSKHVVKSLQSAACLLCVR